MLKMILNVQSCEMYKANFISGCEDVLDRLLALLTLKLSMTEWLILSSVYMLLIERKLILFLKVIFG